MLFKQEVESLHDERKNAEGYNDPTAYMALKNVEAEEDLKRLVSVLKYIIHNSHFELVGRIHLRDKRTRIDYR